MNLVKFKEVNFTFAENQPEYNPLPCFRAGDERGTIVFCYKLSFKERVKLLFSGLLWVSVLTFNQRLQPQYHTVNKDEVLSYDRKPAWYMEKTFRWAVLALTVLVTVFTIGIWIWDGEFPLFMLWGYAFAWVFVPFMTWVFRNNP